jgi:hypothetical protein
MYQPHECFISPENEDSKIWRYMDLVKYADMLVKSSLHFVRADKLNDPFEGSFTRANIKYRPQNYAKLTIPIESFTKQIGDIAKQFKLLAAINSWHLNDSESAAMWNLYAKNNQGIAIQSTFKKLKESLTDNRYTVFIGKITYVDWDSYYIPESNAFSPFLHKRRSFEYEQELRAITYQLSTDDTKNFIPIMENGIDVQTNLKNLIERVYLSPLTPSWILDLIKSVTKKYDYD